MAQAQKWWCPVCGEEQFSDIQDDCADCGSSFESLVNECIASFTQHETTQQSPDCLTN